MRRFLPAVLAAALVHVPPLFAGDDGHGAPAGDGHGPAVPVAALTVEPPHALVRAMRALQLVQDRLALGNATAIDAQRAIIEKLMIDASGEGEADVKARIALAFALMNGADPARLRAHIEAGREDALLRGAAAYAEGRLQDAAAAFAKVEPATLPLALKAQFLLTKGALLAGSDREAALAALAQARLLAPGTLIEEAALRREVALLAAEPDRMLKLAASYLRRFGQSPFASAFISQFAFAIAESDPAAQEKLSAALDDLLAPARAADRQTFYSIVARTSLVSGHHALAKTAAQRAVDVSDDPSALLSARLYRAALAIASDAPGAAATELQSLMRAPLQPADQEILRAAISVARELRRWPFDEQAAPIVPADVPSVRADEQTQPSARMDAARTLLDATDTLVSRP